MAKKASGKKGLTVNIKMYQVGELGDCFLLQFADQGHQSQVLIDCGSFRNGEKSKNRMKEIVSHILAQQGGKRLDVVVGTHQHNDHLSGYFHCADQFRDTVERVWLSWLDDPHDPLAGNINEEQKKLTGQLGLIQNKIATLRLDFDSRQLTDMLAFYATSGNEPAVPAQGMEVLKKIGAQKVRYLHPGEILDLPGLPPDTVKVYVLGPPRNQHLLYRKDPGKGESYDPHLCIANTNARKILDALDNRDIHVRNREEVQFPFKVGYKRAPRFANKQIGALYKGEKWRRIDMDWLEQANRLALYLDSYTNNSSLVLAFELVSSNKVLLFAADAQTGNWLSWDNIEWKNAPKHFKTYDLLQKTVLYKVGHHASHNATLKKALEAMNHDELVAMIPVDRSDPNIRKPNGWKMPASNLYRRLKQKTKYRVLRMDDGFADECHPKRNHKNSRWDELPFLPQVKKINKEYGYIEYTIQG
jgi:beta-lactamase superfamily II metal-dependent hydrolase